MKVHYAKVPDKILPPQNAHSTRTQPLHESQRRSEDTVQDSTIFYIGDESLGLTNLLITHSTCDVGDFTPSSHSDGELKVLTKVFSYSPTDKTSQLQSARTNKMLMRRYAAVQKALDADVFGILVGTLGVGQ